MASRISPAPDQASTRTEDLKQALEHAVRQAGRQRQRLVQARAKSIQRRRVRFLPASTCGLLVGPSRSVKKLSLRDGPDTTIRRIGHNTVRMSPTMRDCAEAVAFLPENRSANGVNLRIDGGEPFACWSARGPADRSARARSAAATAADVPPAAGRSPHTSPTGSDATASTNSSRSPKPNTDRSPTRRSRPGGTPCCRPGSSRVPPRSRALRLTRISRYWRSSMGRSGVPGSARCARRRRRTAPSTSFLRPGQPVPVLRRGRR